MTSDPTVFNALSNYTALPRTVQAKRLEAGGFSGSEIWRVEAAGRSYCLRRWPAQHPNRERLAFIHSVLRRASQEGLPFVPAPLQTASGTTFTEIDSRFWELSPWLPGQANFWDRPTAARLAAAMHALAEFHQATCTIRPTNLGQSREIPPALTERRDRMAGLLAGDFERLRLAVGRQTVRSKLDIPLTAALQLAAEVGGRLLPQLIAACETPLPLQPAIRDIWHDHLLLTGELVTGIVDYGALRIDTPLTDLARLIGSLVEDDRQQREAAISAYSSIQPLSESDGRLIDLIDHSSVVIGLANWATWLYVENRDFDDLAAVETRVLKLCQRLPRLL